MWHSSKIYNKKAKMKGIKVEKIGEEYTSGVSSIEKEEKNVIMLV